MKITCSVWALGVVMTNSASSLKLQKVQTGNLLDAELDKFILRNSFLSEKEGLSQVKSVKTTKHISMQTVMIVEVFDMMTSRIYNNKIPSSVSYPYILPRLRAALLKQSRGKLVKIIHIPKVRYVTPMSRTFPVIIHYYVAMLQLVSGSRYMFCELSSSRIHTFQVYGIANYYQSPGF